MSTEPQEAQEVEEVRVIPLPSGFKPANEPDTVLQKTMPVPLKDLAATANPTMGLNFEGVGTGIPNFRIPGAPPDTEGAVGLTQYVQWVNLSFAVFDKTTGNLILGPTAGNTLWAGFGGGCETDNDGDPIVTYDKLANRWVFSQLVVRNGPFLQCIAVSTTSDATGTYNRYSFEYSNFDDYPKMGVWPDAYYETFNMFVSASGPFVGADACAYDRNAMLNGQPATQVCFQQASTVGGLLPADLDGRITPPAGSPNYMVEFDVNSLNLYRFHVDFVTPSNSTFTGPVSIPVAPFTPFCPTVRGCVPQPGGDGTNLDSLGDRLMHRLAYRNFGDHESLVVNHSVVADPVNQNSGIRWYEIQNPGGAAPTVAQQSTFAPDPSFRWMGSVAMDASGNLAVGYSVTNSATSLFPSVALATRGAFDPPSILQSETSIVTGTGAQTGGLTRWGDYSAMQVDPVDDCTFWYTNEYLQTTGSFNWNTRIANFKFPGCGAQALSIAASHAGNFTQGQTGATYTLTVTNIGSKPTDGTAVTVTDTLPAGLAATAISSTDATWVCTLATLSCTRSDVLAAGKSYAPITVTVNVAANAPGLVTNTATVSGGGSKDTTDNTSNDVTTIIVTGPDPAIAKTHVPLVQGQTAIYVITVTNRGLTATDPTQPVTVTDTLPPGVTALAAAGTGWGTCTVGATVTCARSDSLASNQSYPPIAISVSVGANAFTTVVNTASVAGGGDVNPFNNTANDPATVLITAPGLAFTSPAVPQVPSVAVELKPGAQIAIAGTATGPSFQDFRLQWAEGINPSTGWNSAGITLTGGSAPVTKGPLGTWDTSGITQADYYSIRLTVDDAGFSNSIVTFVYLEPGLISSHWPIALQVAPEFYSGFQALPDALGNQRIFLVTPATLSGLPGQYLTFSPDGSSQISLDVSGPGQLNPAAGQLDGFPGGDAVVPNRNASSDTAQVQLFHSDNSGAVISLPASLNPITFNFYTFDFQVPVLEDMEGTGQLDFVSLAMATPGFNGVDHSFVLALRPDGSLLSGSFPVVIPDQNGSLLLTFKPRVLVGDVQGNGSKEFVVISGTTASTFTLLQFAHDGTPVPWAVPEFSGTPAAMVLADLDHNGMLETILTVATGTPSGEDDLTMHVFQPDGSERPGWPVDLGGVNPDDFTFSQLMVGDLNRDGTEEIIVAHANGGVLVLEPDGTALPGFSEPALIGNLAGTLALADIDGDGFPEIIVSEYHGVSLPGLPALSSTSTSPGADITTARVSLGPNGIASTAIHPAAPPPQAGGFYFTQFLQAIRRDGTIARTWTLQGMEGSQPASIGYPAITVGDFNNDGLTDIALNYATNTGAINGAAGVAVVLTTGTSFNAAVNDWPMVFQNPRNTAVLRRDVTVVLTSPVGGGTAAGAVPITATTTGKVASVQFKIDGVDFGAPLTTAPFTLSWDTTQAALGSHQLVAIAADSNGRPVASAPLTVNVIRGSSSTTTLALTAGTSPSTFGNSLTLTATVAPNTASGSVTFLDGNTPIAGAVTLSGGSASLTTSLLGAGTHNITARYSGDSLVGASISALLSLTVNRAGSATALASSSLSATSGAPVTFTATVTSATATPAGPVQFLDGSTPLGAVSLNSQGVGTFTTNSLSIGSHSITAQYSGGSNFSPSTSSPVSEKIVGTSSVSLALIQGTNPSRFGDFLLFDASISPNTATGTIVFFDGNTAISGSMPVNGGGATLPTSGLAGGTHSLTAQYSGDVNFLSSTSPALVQNVQDVSLTASPSSATVTAGGSATFTFTVTPLGGFNQAVTFSCSGLPALSQCVFNPPTLTPNGSPVTSVLTIATTASSASLMPAPQTPSRPGNNLPLYASLFATTLGIAGLALARRRGASLKPAKLWLGLSALCVVAGLTSCGGGGTPPTPRPGTPPGTSQVAVTVHAGADAKTATVTLVVQ